jgi:transcription elongation factor Elf1
MIKLGWTTIRLKSETVQELRKVGKKEEIYDNVIKRLLELYKKYDQKGVPPVCPFCGGLLLGIIASANKSKLYCESCEAEFKLERVDDLAR